MDELHTYTFVIDVAPYIWHNMNIHLQLFAGEQVIRAVNDPSANTYVLSVSVDVPLTETRLCLYVVPHTLPSSRLVADVPSSDLTIKVMRDDTLLDNKEYEVNRWAGLQLIGLPFR